MKSLIFAVLAIFFVGCTTEVVEDVSEGLATVPQTLIVDFDEDDSRAQLGEETRRFGVRVIAYRYSTNLTQISSLSSRDRPVTARAILST